jgi:hypothetical protein
MNYKMIYLARRNPSCKAEDWPRHWRSHAVYCSQFPAIGAPISSLHYCSRQLKPTLDGAPFDPPRVADYDGVAVVASQAADSFGDNDLSRELRDKIDADETRVFSTLTPNFSFLAEETLVLGDKPGSAAVIRFLARKVGSSREEFLAHLGMAHAEAARQAINAAGTVTRYVHNRLRKEPPRGFPFDAIVETWFASAEDAARSLVDGAFAPLTLDLATFCDVKQSVTMLTYVTHAWPRQKAL